jgi:hypothetical protein
LTSSALCLAKEVKLPGKKPTPGQLEFLDTVHQKRASGTTT